MTRKKTFDRVFIKEIMAKLLIWLSNTATDQHRHQFVIALNQLGIKIKINIYIDHVDTDFITDQLSKRYEQIITKVAITA